MKKTLHRSENLAISVPGDHTERLEIERDATGRPLLDNANLPFVRAHFARVFLIRTGFLSADTPVCLFGLVLDDMSAARDRNVPEHRAVSVFFVRPIPR